MEQPKTTPICCSKPAKWVEQTPSLAYFYCETCKTEPKVIDDSLVNLNLATGFSDIGGSWQRIMTPYPPPGSIIFPIPPVRTSPPSDELDNYNVGSRVQAKYSGALGTVHAVDRASRTICVAYDYHPRGMLGTSQSMDDFILLS